MKKTLQQKLQSHKSTIRIQFRLKTEENYIYFDAVHVPTILDETRDNMKFYP